MNDLPLTIEAMQEYLENAPPEKVAELRELASEYMDGRLWTPQPGPQYEAYHSEADELLYGGAAGGGKTDLLIGLATEEHERSLIFRRMSKDLDALWSRLSEVAGPEVVTNNTVKNTLITTSGRTVEGGHLEKPGSEKGWQGRPHDFIGFDEAAQLDELKVNFVMQWLRSTTAGQRQRVVMGTNPPLPEFVDGKMVDHGTGGWLIRWFAPWLDGRFPDPAVTGELRWCFMEMQGERLVTIWVQGPGTYDSKTHEPFPDATEQDVIEGRAIHSKSRTFIKSLLKDNAYLKGTGYAERLSATPEPLRSMLMAGVFNMRLEDGAMQVIPTSWVVAAQERWQEREHMIPNLKQIVIANDIAQGGVDNTTHGGLLQGDVFEEIVSRPGRETPDGPSVVAGIIKHRRDGSIIVLDGTGGWAGDTYRTLTDNQKIEDVQLHVSSSSEGTYDKNGRYKHKNARTKMWWDFREALDPTSDFKIALPPGERVLEQLTAPTYTIEGGGSTELGVVIVESKKEIRKRIGASTDDADVILMAWQYRGYALEKLLTTPTDVIAAYNDPEYSRRQAKGAGYAAPPVDEVDPLADW